MRERSAPSRARPGPRRRAGPRGSRPSTCGWRTRRRSGASARRPSTRRGPRCRSSSRRRSSPSPTTPPARLRDVVAARRASPPCRRPRARCPRGRPRPGSTRCARRSR